FRMPANSDEKTLAGFRDGATRREWPAGAGLNHEYGLSIGLRAVVVNDALIARFRLLLVAANRLVDFITMDRNFLRGFHPEANFVAADFYDHDRNIIIDDDTFVLFP